MAVYNYAGGEANIKIVYYGPGLSGKTTNLEHMYAKLPRENKGKMVSMKTRTDRTLFFDFLPIEVGELGALKVRFLLYTVPGQVYYNATRKLVLKGVDAVVFVADSSAARMSDNVESLGNLEENLNEIGKSLAEIPWVMQYNKRDVADRLPVATLDSDLNTWDAPAFEAVATEGTGVYETFEAIARLVFKQLKRELNDREIDRGPDEEGEAAEAISVEVVAQGRKSANCSETDESETSGYAEEREEEHESVSEFVDNVLQEKARAEDGLEDLSSDRDGNEEYGHMVELGGGGVSAGDGGGSAGDGGGSAGDGGGSAGDGGGAALKTTPRTEPASREPEAVEERDDGDRAEADFINDPLDRLEEGGSEALEPGDDEKTLQEPQEGGSAAARKRITVPVTLTGREAAEGCDLEIVVELTVGPE